MTSNIMGQPADPENYGIQKGHVNVVVRVRPLNNSERFANESNVLQFPGNGGIVATSLDKEVVIKNFTFNVVFEPEATQKDVFEHCGVEEVVDYALAGYSTTCICYGQTGSGKTHTLSGPPNLLQSPDLDISDPNHGLMVRTFNYLFEKIRALNKNDEICKIKASYLEIYNEKAIDLLNQGSKRLNLPLRWNKQNQAFNVENLFVFSCSETQDLVNILVEGTKNRALGSHSMNEHSSRGHTLLTVYIEIESKTIGDNGDTLYITRHGKINFVDLAGSEMVKKTKSSGKALTEANNINKSLMVLGNCISALSKSGDRKVHIPYRDSKLTKLLADGLSGNGITLMIACVSPAASSISETINTLRYAARAKKIRTQPFVIMDPREAMILNLKRRVETLSAENVQLRNVLKVDDSNYSVKTMTPGYRKISAKSNNADMDIHEDLGNDAQSFSDFDEFSPHDSRPPSQRSKKTLRQVSSFLFISTPTSSGGRAGRKKLEDLDSSTLVDLIKDYMVENEELRRNNYELFAVKDMIMRDQEMVCLENERLIKKVEECEQFHNFGGKSRVSDLVRHRKTGSNTSLPEMINNSAKQYDSSSADDESNQFKSRESSGELPYSLKRELERRRIKSGHRNGYRMSADSEESFDDISADLRLRSITSRSSSGSKSIKRRQRSKNHHRKLEETHF